MNRLTTIGMSLLALALVSATGGCTADGLGGPAAKPVLGAGTVKDPVQIPYVKDAMKIDGNAADWSDVGFLPAPFMKKPAGSVKMCWKETGLYMLAVVKDKGLETDSVTPWSADCVELFLEKDAAGALDATDNPAVVQYCFAPTPEMGEGRCDVFVPQGDKKTAGKVVSAWKKTADGYVMEVLIPAAVLAPAKLVPGTKLNVNVAINDDGKAVEQLFSDKSADDGYKTPKSWGTVILTK